MRIRKFNWSLGPSDNGDEPYSSSNAGRLRGMIGSSGASGRKKRSGRDRNMSPDDIAGARGDRFRIAGYPLYFNISPRCVPREEAEYRVDRAEKLALVRQRVADGYYDDPGNMEKVVDALIEKLILDETGN